MEPTPQTEPAHPAGRRPSETVASPADLDTRLEQTGYLADEALATIAWLAVRMGRPLLLEGEPGTGKTALAEALGRALELPVLRLQCYEGIDASQALYDWDFPRQILHLRALEATRAAPATAPSEADHTSTTPGQPEDGRTTTTSGAADTDLAAVEDELFTERFLLARPVLRALRDAPVVLLVDEIDRADDEFEAFLLEVLSTWQVSIPELGTVRAPTPPVVVLTSNRTRDLHDALKRRCLYHWIDHPGLERELQIVRRHLPHIPDLLAEQVVLACQRLRADQQPTGDLVKPPGVAETIDWARALLELGAVDLDVETAAATLGVAVKHRDDAERVRAGLDRVLAR